MANSHCMHLCSAPLPLTPRIGRWMTGGSRHLSLLQSLLYQPMPGELALYLCWWTHSFKKREERNKQRYRAREKETAGERRVNGRDRGRKEGRTKKWGENLIDLHPSTSHFCPCIKSTSTKYVLGFMSYTLRCKQSLHLTYVQFKHKWALTWLEQLAWGLAGTVSFEVVGHDVLPCLPFYEVYQPSFPACAFRWLVRTGDQQKCGPFPYLVCVEGK